MKKHSNYSIDDFWEDFRYTAILIAIPAVILIVLLIIYKKDMAQTTLNGNTDNETFAESSEMGYTTTSVDRFENKEQDKVSSNYETTLLQVPADQIISEYKEKGYNYVELESHEVTYPKDSVGEIGTEDRIHIYATYSDADSLFEVNNMINALYIYWGTEIGWVNTLDEIIVSNYDITGFNGTYWKFKEDNNLASNWPISNGYSLACSLLGNEKMMQFDEDNCNIDVYISLYNFDRFTVEKYYSNTGRAHKVWFYEDTFGQNSVIGTATILVDGNVYGTTDLHLRKASGNSYKSIIDLSNDSVEFYFNDCTSLYHYAGVDAQLVPVSEEEYKAAVR